MRRKGENNENENKQQRNDMANSISGENASTWRHEKS